MIVESYKQAVRMRMKTPDEIQEEMDNPAKANFALHEYHMPNGVILGVGKSKRPGHGSLYQLIVTDFNGKPNVKIEEEYAGEYTSTGRAEKALQMYCKHSWEAAEDAKTTAVRKTEKAKQEAKETEEKVDASESGE